MILEWEVRIKRFGRFESLSYAATIARIRPLFGSHQSPPRVSLTTSSGADTYMKAFDWQRMALDEFPVLFLGEVALRALFAYLLVFIFLKTSGRRGIRQLSVFELVVILTLGSAAGDVSFYHDVPLLPVLVVFLTLLGLYRLTTQLITRNQRVSAWIEGVPSTIIRDGLYEIDNLRAQNISEDEFFMELRQQSVEHLGQVRLGILELDGEVSLFFFDEQATRPGLSTLPPQHRPVYTLTPVGGLYACTRCGCARHIDAQMKQTCPRCDNKRWSLALDTVRAR